MKSSWIGSLLVVLLTAAFLGGCCCPGGGSSSKTETTINSTTLGQQLTDLKEAYDKGAITEKEYNKQRQEILDKAN